jgi:hypothetical protein
LSCSSTRIGRKQFRSAQNQWNHQRNFPYIKQIPFCVSKKSDIGICLILNTHLAFRDRSQKHFCPVF